VLVTLQSAATTTLGQVQTTLNTALGNVSLSLDGTANFLINGTAATSAQLALTMEQLFAVNFDADDTNDIDSFVVNLALTGDTRFTKATGNALGGADIDLGLDDLGVELDGSASLDFVVDYGLNIGLGYSPEQGFFVNGTADDEIEVSVGLGFSPGTELALDLGPLHFSLTEEDEVADSGETSGAIVVGGGVTQAQAIENRELHAALNLDLGSGPLTGSGADLLDDLTVTLIPRDPTAPHQRIPIIPNEGSLMTTSA
jgi:hypothetical protein